MGATLVNVKRRPQPTLVPRSRQALDGAPKVVPNPRISAGSTVDISGPASVRNQEHSDGDDTVLR